MPLSVMSSLTAVLAATDVTRQRLTSGRLDGFTEWWQGPLSVVVVAAVVGLAIWLYRRDAVELSPRLAAGLAVLRVAALVCLLAAWLDFQRRDEHELIFPSRVAVLVDSSASMALPERSADDTAGDQTAGDAGSAADRPPTRTRLTRAMQVLDEGGLLDALSATHEVSLWRFDAGAEPLAVLPTAAAGASEKEARAKEDAGNPSAGDETAGDAGDDTRLQTEWRPQISASGFETRLGEALLRVAEREPLDVLAGVIVLTDGASNAGADPRAAAADLAEAGVPVLPLGFGSDRLPANIRVADVTAPSRVFPDDRFAVTASLQQQGFGGATVRCELAETQGDAIVGGRVIDAVDVRLADDGELAAVRFDVPGLSTPGRRGLVVRVKPLAAAARDENARDDAQATEVEVVDRVTEVLLIAGGPTREYQFMRNVLKRDESFGVDVLLATARDGTSQDARAVLDAFPQTPEELDRYDVIVAFDVDWRDLDPLELARLERWVARESGGLVLVSGPVNMEAWLSSPQTSVIRNLYPIELRRQPTLLVDAPASREQPMPLAFTPDGIDAEFLWLGDSRIASQTLWAEFPGVYACFDATEAKPGGTVYARARREGAALAGTSRDPIYMAGQFYGSGLVLTLGSGELWRLRAVEVAAFERLTTQIVRHVSQGRLLRGSRDLRLLVDRDRYAVGSTVDLRVVLREESDPSRQPRCEVIRPDGGRQPLALVADPARPGELRGSFMADGEGSWRIEASLPPDDGSSPSADDTETVSRRIVAQLPDQELKAPRLDRGSLEQLAGITGGTVRVLGPKSWSRSDSAAMVASLQDRSRHEFQSGAIDTDFKRALHLGLLAAGVGLLCTEWILRRLARLA